MLKRLTSCLFLCAATGALAETTAEAVTFASCALCHGDGAGEGAIPAINGQPYEELRTKLHGFAGTEAEGTIMHRFVTGLTAEEIEDLARYVSGLEGPAR